MDLIKTCGGSAYDLASEFCGADSQVYKKCAGEIYNGVLEFCGSDDQIYEKCGGSAYDIISEFCGADGQVYKKCAGEVYDVTTEFCDYRDNQLYATVKIGEQIWMAKNLNYETENSYCYDDDPANCEVYGRLYTWEAALNACPEGYHLPTKTEFETLISNVGGSDVAGKMLKSTTGWDENGNGEDTFGFNVLPAGYRNSYSEFVYAGERSVFWSATELSELFAYNLVLLYSGENVLLNDIAKGFARSVRCLRGSN